MIELLISNLIYVGYAMALLAIFWGANFAFSLYHNVKQLNEVFELKKMLDGVSKILILCIGTALLTVGITLLPIFAQVVGLVIAEEVLQAFNILVVIGIYFESSYGYFTQAKETLTSIVQFRKTMKEVKEVIDDTSIK